LKYLCVCQYAHSRSVAMCRYLHGKGVEAVAAGAGTAPSVFGVLGAWADKIVVMEPDFARAVPPEFRDKIVLVNVGPDRWSNPYNADLAALIVKLAAEAGI